MPEKAERESAPLRVEVFTRRSLFFLALWFGLAAGLLELLFLVIRVRLFEKGFFLRSRHFLWMVPLSDLLIFAAVGFAVVLPWPRLNRFPLRLVLGVLLFLSLMCQLLLVRGLNALACAVFAAGVAFQASRWIASHPIALTRVMRSSAPVLATLLIALLAFSAFSGAGGLLRESAASTPAPPGAPNVLFIVLDTVRADDLSLYGYPRDTSPNLARLASSGVRFDLARATAPWTLPSHASMFTGYRPHDLGVEKLGWLDKSVATLAEVMRSHGYDTAGFVANTFFCGHESGLARGFDHYEDYPVGPAEVLRSSSVGWLLFRTASRVSGEIIRLYSGDPQAGIILDFARKDATTVNAEFLAWVDRPRSRPFFAFLNYFDAHDPYIPPRGEPTAVPSAPRSHAQYQMLRDWQKLEKSQLSPADLAIARAAYDECIAALDRDLGKLFGSLERRGLLDNTLVVVTADHGEQFGEHGEFGHGFSVYQPEIHVPLLVRFPPKVPTGRVVREAVSLRDLPATVLELSGLGGPSPFPGRSLSVFWREGEVDRSAAAKFTAPFSELAAPIEKPTVKPPSDRFSGPAQCVLVGTYVYIRHGGGAEELYDLSADPAEQSNQISSADPELLDRCRSLLLER